MTKERKLEILKDLLIQLSDSANILCTCEADERCEVVEECIKALEQQPSDETIKYLECNDIDVQEFIKAMKRQPLQAVQPNSMQLIFEMMNRPTCDDCVSRQAVVEYIKASNAELGHDCENEDVRDDILNMPPVTPTHKQGKWDKGYGYPDGAYWKCSCCNELIKVKIPMHFCSNCGAEMENGEKND